MARIPDEEIKRLKQEISVQRLAEARGVVLKRHGSNLIGLCPFHDDHNPSLVITPSKNLWHCLGACQAGGSVIDWVMKAEGVSFRHAVELLREDNFSLAACSSSRPVKRSKVGKLLSPVDQDVDDWTLLHQVIDYYHEILKQSPEALAYLEKRGLKSSEMIERFKLGYANRTLGYRLPIKTRKAGAEIRGRLEHLGILRRTGHEHFNGSLVIPVFDEQGGVAEVYGRKIRNDLRKGTPLHLYLPGPHKGVWNSDALQASREIILCEALIDALTFWCAGFRNVTSSYGIEGFTDDHLNVFKKYETERVLIAYDRDDAGERAAQALAEKLMAEGVSCYRIHFPKGMDANDYALKVTPPSKSLGLLIRNAIWLGKGKPPAVAPGAEPMVVDASKDQAAKEAKEEKDCSTPEALADSEDVTLPAKALPSLVADLEPPAASPEPPAPSIQMPAEVKVGEVVIRFGDRRYRVRGLGKNMSFDQLKINILCARGEGFHVDTLDLYSARQRSVFIKQASEELGFKEEVIKKDLGKVLLKLEELQEEQIKKALEPKEKTVML